jgi:glucose/arabinose dehydrogenase
MKGIRMHKSLGHRRKGRSLAAGWLGLLLLAGPLNAGPDARGLPQVRLELLVSGLTEPVHVTHAGDRRLFVVEQQGRIRIVLDGTLLERPFLDITSLVTAGGERGLLSVAFHPGYPAVPYLFVDYTRRSTGQEGTHGDTVIARYRVSADRDVADPASAKTLLVIDQPSGNHNGGQLAFGPDGYLYVGMGDGGGSCDDSGFGLRCRAQRAETLLGKMLRLDVDQNVETTGFGIPADNPFRQAGDPLDKVWARGLRNPWRFSFDRLTGDLWIADVGQSTREEVNRQPAGSPGGENYGWPVMEGSQCSAQTDCAYVLDQCPEGTPQCDAPGLVQPIHDYPRSDGGVIIGGHVYRGHEIPSLQGHYVFGDLSSNRLWALDPESRERFDLPAPPAFGLTSFGEDQLGELYAAVTVGGGLYRLVNAAEPAPVPAERPGMILMTLAAAAGCVVLQRSRRRLARRAARTGAGR